MSRLSFLMLGLLLLPKILLCAPEEPTQTPGISSTKPASSRSVPESETTENKIGFFKENVITTSIVVGLVAFITYIFYRHVQHYDHQQTVSRLTGNQPTATPATPKPYRPTDGGSEVPRLAASPFPQQQLLRSYSSQSLTSTTGKTLSSAFSEANLGACVKPTPIQLPDPSPLVQTLEREAGLLSPASSPTRQFQTYRDMLNAAQPKILA